MSGKFDRSKDKCLESWTMGDVDNEANVLIIGIYKYGDGAPKLGFTRTFIDRKTDQVGIKSSGRLTKDEVEFLFNKVDEINKVIEEHS